MNTMIKEIRNQAGKLLAKWDEERHMLEIKTRQAKETIKFTDTWQAVVVTQKNK